MRARVTHLIVNIAGGSPLMPVRGRTLLYRLAGFEIGAGTTISPRCFFGRAMSFGRRCFVNYDCFFNTSGGISVGDDVHFGPGVAVVTSTHDVGPANRRAGAVSAAPVVIESGCWLGARVTVLPGVTIGAGCIVAAGAVVTSSLDPNGLYAGVPARRVRDLPE